MPVNMCEIELKISFNTPAFLGNAEQKGQWRTPPFKALFRQWWRVVKASKGCGLDVIRREESELFGNAIDNGELQSQQSKIRFKFENWNLGNCSDSIDAGKIEHPEVYNKKDRSNNISASLYLGFGPITNTGVHSYIKPLFPNTLWLRFPERYRDEIVETIQLIQWFGTVGSRSRNGWGSVCIDEFKVDNEINNLHEPKFEYIESYAEYYETLMTIDWPSRIGRDNQGLLVWKTSERDKYEEVINDLAGIKISFRTMLTFTTGKNSQIVEERHTVAYPVTNHNLRGLSKAARNANQIRFKVNKHKNGKYYGLIYHLPCCVADSFFYDGFAQKEDYLEIAANVWGEIHTELNNLCQRLE